VFHPLYVTSITNWTTTTTLPHNQKAEVVVWGEEP